MTIMHALPRAVDTGSDGAASWKTPWVGWPSAAPAWPVLAIVCFVCGVTTRLIGIDLVITADEGLWMQRTIRFGANLARANLEGTYRTGHPGVTVMWVGLAALGPGRLGPLTVERLTRPERLEQSPGYLDALSGARIGVVVGVAALVALVTQLACKLLGPGPGLVGTGLLLLDPYVIGSSRVLHPDALLAPLMTVSALAGLVYWTGERHPAYLVLSGATGGLALLTKTTGIHAAFFFGLVALVAASPWRNGNRRELLAVAAWGVLAAATYGALWPALWADPLGRLADVAAFTRTSGGEPHEAGNFFLGRSLAEDPGPLFYPVALAFRLGPIASIGLLALATAFVQRRARDVGGGALRQPVLWLLAYAFLFVTMMTLGAKKLDRYMLPAIWMLDILAGAGLWLLAARVAVIPVAAWRHAARDAGGGVALALQAMTLWLAYPYPLASYNPLVGGIDAARRTMLVGWGEGLEQVADYLGGTPNARALNVAVNYPHVLLPRLPGTTYDMLPYLQEDPSVARARPDFFVVYVNAAQRGQIPPAAQAAIDAGPPELTAVVHGQAYAWVYRATSER